MLAKPVSILHSLIVNCALDPSNIVESGKRNQYPRTHDAPLLIWIKSMKLQNHTSNAINTLRCIHLSRADRRSAHHAVVFMRHAFTYML